MDKEWPKRYHSGVKSCIQQDKFEYYLKSFSNTYWLRPMTAIWRAIEAAYFDFESIYLNNQEKEWVDLGVGDGIFTSVATGLRLPKNFDAYWWLKENWETNLDLEGRPDLFDSVPTKKFSSIKNKNFKLNSKVKIKTPWALGIDHKSNLLLKAKVLGTFKSLREATFNDPDRLFDKNEIFDLCFSNSLYWSKNPSSVLNKIRLHVNESSNPSLLLSLQLPNFAKYRQGVINDFGQMGDFFDRGRKEHYQSVYEAEKWLKILNESGFEVIENYFMANKNLVHSIEWMDNRELYPYFAKMRSKLKYRDQMKIKLEISDYIQKLGTECFKSGVFDADMETSSYLLIKARAI